jgi:hypothetical protein
VRAALRRAALGPRQFPLIELYEVSSPLLLSANELVGQRSAGEKQCAGNLSAPESLLESPLENRSAPSSSRLVPNVIPEAEERPVWGHRDSWDVPLDIDAARDAKSAPSPEPEAAPARSAQLLPTPLTPQVRELSPKFVGDVPIDPLPLPTAAVVLAYSPIVCAWACDARNAITEINTAAGNNKFFRLIASPC